MFTSNPLLDPLIGSSSADVASLSQTPVQVAQAPKREDFTLICHRISAGFPSPAGDYLEDELDLNSYLIRSKPSTFFFSVKGDSMIGAGIHHGDLVAVDRALVPVNSDIVIAVVNGEYTIKRYVCHSGQVELHPENPSYQPMVFKEGSELQIWGVVIGSIRKYKKRGAGPGVKS